MELRSRGAAPMMDGAISDRRCSIWLRSSWNLRGYSGLSDFASIKRDDLLLFLLLGLLPVRQARLDGCCNYVA
jgi:hypothetical protein